MSKHHKDTDYNKLGKQFEAILDEQYAVLHPHWKKRIKRALLQGAFAGIGSVLGATLGIALLIFVLYQLRGVPIIGDAFKAIADMIKR